jgi:hypothetical protein
MSVSKSEPVGSKANEVVKGLEGLAKGTELADTAARIGGVVTLLRALGVASSGAAFGLATLAGGMTFMVQHFLKKREAAARAVQDEFARARQEGVRSAERLQHDNETGALASDKAVAFKERITRLNAEIAELEERAKKAPLAIDLKAANLINQAAIGGAGNPYPIYVPPLPPVPTQEDTLRLLATKRAERDATMAEAEAARRITPATALAVDEAAARARNTIAQRGFDREHQDLEASLAKNLVSRRAYLRDYDALTEREATSRLEIVDTRARHLETELQRQKDAGVDRDTIARTESDLWSAYAEGKQILLGADHAKAAERLRLEQSAYFKPMPVDVDELACIGLFRGGGGQADIGMQQLEMLKQIVEGVRRVEVTTRNA